MLKTGIKSKGRLFCFFIFLTGQIFIQADTTFAVTANPHPVIYTQPDGTKLTIVLQGDEFVHWAITSDGYTVLTNSYGTYEYASLDDSGKLVFSGIRASDPENRSQTEVLWLLKTGKGVFFSKGQVKEMRNHLFHINGTDTPLTGGFPSTGTRKLLMILANFSNTVATCTQNNFSNCMNQVNYNGTGSFRDYYLEVSYGQLTVNTTVTVWITLPNTHDYYGPDTKWGEFAYDAVIAAKNQAGINFADFDNNMDGIVDGIAIIHQGQGQEETGIGTDIWSHSWKLSEAGYSAAQRTFDGVQADAYTAMPEKNAAGIGSIGVMCHEFCHNLGSPDFYDTDYTINGSYTGTGKWDLMAGGSWNGVSGTKPAHPNAWIKALLNWTVPVVLSTAQTTTLRNAQTSADVVRFNTQTPNEYFLCENRQQTGFDAGIPGHGLIIYHVDGNYISAQMSTNSINTSAHQGLYPVCASATGNPTASYGTINGTGCPFPGTGNKTSYSDVTTPHARSWANANTNCPVTNIFEYTPAQEVSFCMISCNTPSDPVNFSAAPGSTSQVNLSWGLNSGASPVIVAFNQTPAFGTPAEGTDYPAGSFIPGGGTVVYNGSGISFTHTGLSASTTYYYKAWSALNGETFSAGVVSRATTLCGTVSAFPWNENFENGGALPGCWIQEQVGNSGLNWTFPAGNGGTNPAAAHSGTYNACLKDKTAADNKTRLIAPVLNLTSLSNPQLSFWHTQPVWSTDQDLLSVYYKTTASGSWILLATYTGNVASWTQETIGLPNAAATYYIAFEGNAKFGYGICIDDVQVANGCTAEVPVSVTITASMNPVYEGTLVTNTAIACNGGSAPTYQWNVSGTIVQGATNATFSKVPVNNEEISCIMTSNEACAVNNPATSNSLVLLVNSYPNLSILQNFDITDTRCYDAIQTISVAGNGTGFTVENGASVTMIAGGNIKYLPGMLVKPGGYLHGFITTAGQFCSSKATSFTTSTDGAEPFHESLTNPVFRVFPNPTAGDFVLDLTVQDIGKTVQVFIYSMTGDDILSSNLTGGKKHDLSLRNQPDGIYLLQVISGKNTAIARVIKR